MRLWLMTLIPLLTNAMEIQHGDQEQNQQREDKQFWTMYDHAPSMSGAPQVPLASGPGMIAPLLLTGGPNMRHPLSHHEEDAELEEKEERREGRVKEEKDLKERVAVIETIEEPNVSSDDEQVLVEQVNAMIGAMGRQALNGVKIFSSETAPNTDILPGRPQNLGGMSTTSSQFKPSESGVDDCCLFVFFDGSAYFFDEYLRLLTGFYRLMYGSVNGHPHYVARGCTEAEVYGPNCSYIWHSGQGWVIGVGTYIGQTKGVVYTRSQHRCPTQSSAKWRYLNTDLEWKDDGNVVVKCAS